MVRGRSRALPAWQGPVGGALLVLSLVACGVLVSTAAAGACDLAAPTFSITGPAEAVVDEVVTFEVRSVQTLLDVSSADLVPAVGDRIEVSYSSEDVDFLRAGREYSVAVWGQDRFASGVHRAQDTCGGGGTRYADGSPIDTGVLQLVAVRPQLLVLLLVPVVLAALAAMLVRWWWRSDRQPPPRRPVS